MAHRTQALQTCPHIPQANNLTAQVDSTHVFQFLAAIPSAWCRRTGCPLAAAGTALHCPQEIEACCPVRGSPLVAA
eukprot:1159421-Pelagomonas_calceolata.AAC.10